MEKSKPKMGRFVKKVPGEAPSGKTGRFIKKKPPTPKRDLTPSKGGYSKYAKNTISKPNKR